MFRLTTCLICRRLYMRSLYLFCRKESSVGAMPKRGMRWQMDEGYLQGHLPVRHLGDSLFLQKFIFTIVIVSSFIDSSFIVSRTLSPPYRLLYYVPLIRELRISRGAERVNRGITTSASSWGQARGMSNRYDHLLR